MRKHIHVPSILCLTFSLFVSSCSFNLTNEQLQDWFKNNNHEHIYIDERQGIKQVTQDISVPTGNNGIQSGYYASYEISLNSPGNHYIICPDSSYSDIYIEILTPTGSLITSYYASNPKGFSYSGNTLIVKITNRNSYTYTVSTLKTTSAVPETDTDNVFGSITFKESGIAYYEQTITLNKKLPSWVSSYYLDLPTSAKYTISATASNSNVEIKLDYIKQSDGSFSGDNGAQNAQYSINNPSVFDTTSPPSGYRNDQIRLELFNSNDATVYTIKIKADRAFAPATLTHRYDI